MSRTRVWSYSFELRRDVSRSLISIALLIAAYPSYGANPGTFSYTGSLSIRREYASATLISGCNCPDDGKVLIAGGVDTAFTGTTNTAELYDPTTHKFTLTGSMNVARGGHAAALLPGGRVLIVGAIDSPGPDDAEIYDPKSRTFSCVAGINPTNGYCNATIASNALVVTLTPVTMVTAGTVAGTVTTKTKILITGLQTPTSGGQLSNAAALFDVESGIFACVSGMSSTPLVCNPSTASRHTNGTSTLLANGKVLLAGGTDDSGYTNGVELYDPTLGPTGTFVTVHPLTVARAYHTATLLNNGQVLIAGGAGNAAPLFAAEIYDPPTDSFAVVGNMAHDRISHTATRLSNGSVLIAGGAASNGATLPDAELYDPVAKMFRPTGNMNSSRITHTATLLTNGLVLVAGGIYDLTAELYTPPTLGPWHTLRNRLCTKGQPCFSASTALLLTDGTLMVQEDCALNWWKLTPDLTGSYVNGAWSQLAPMGYGPRYYASAVLQDGRVLVEGGEDTDFLGTCTEAPAGQETTQGAIFDPTAGPMGMGSWKSMALPGWKQIGDAPGIVLASGQFMLGACCSKDEAILTFSGTTHTWATTGFGKSDSNAEEGWTLLPDGNVLTVDTGLDVPLSELFDPMSNNWSSPVTQVGVQLPITCNVGYVPEIGPALLRPDGTVFATGGTNHTAIFHSANHTWSKGPDFPVGLGVADGPAALLRSGNVLVGASPNAPCYAAPSTFYEFNGNSLIPVPGPPRAVVDPSFVGRMLLLPTGQVLFTDGTSDIEIYTPRGSPKSGWAPTIMSIESKTITRGQKYSISGTNFNGLSQGAAYGDDAQMATNYPLVRITNTTSKHVFYARTHDHSSMGVATAGKPVSTSTYFNVLDPNMEIGASTLVVVANGIASAPVSISVK